MKAFIQFKAPGSLPDYTPPEEEAGNVMERLEYHQQRAREELDRAYRAEHSAAANAHMRLASLHMQQLKRDDERCGGTDCERPARFG